MDPDPEGSWIRFQYGSGSKTLTEIFDQTKLPSDWPIINKDKAIWVSRAQDKEAEKVYILFSKRPVKVHL